MGNNGRVAVNTSHLIADELSFDFHKQITGLQVWNVILQNLPGLVTVGSLKHDLYPQGFTGVILLADGHIGVQFDPGHVTLTLCSNAGSSKHEQLRSTLWVAFDEIEP
jgi:S-adenosylmethionine/arginine decarboxylase-like enzyme